MTEGLRVAPAYLDARRDNLVPKSCEECKRTQTMVTRQYMRCGYEPAVSDQSAQSWSPSYMTTTVCPGYSTALPAVAEVLDVHAHWKAGYLTESLDGEAPTKGALDCLSALEAGINEHQADVMRRTAKGGSS